MRRGEVVAVLAASKVAVSWVVWSAMSKSTQQWTLKLLKGMFSVSVAWNSALITSSAAPLNAGYRCSAPVFSQPTRTESFPKGLLRVKPSRISCSAYVGAFCGRYFACLKGRSFARKVPC